MYMIVEKAMQYCRNALRNVSRSFALTIPLIEKNILVPILVGYLEARVLDSFEDEKNGDDFDVEKRMENMDKLIDIINNPDSPTTNIKIMELSEVATKIICNPHYLDLAQNMDKVMVIHKTMDKNAKQAISKWFSVMSSGMQKYLNKRIDTFEHLDEYCYYVGGTIGGFVTELLIKNTKVATPHQVKILKMEHNDFGLFLQKVNIIRDFRQDLLRNEKIFWPYSIFREQNITPKGVLEIENEAKAMIILDKMLANVKKHVDPVKRYLSAIPEDYPGFKKASAINFLMGVETLIKIKNNSDVFYSEYPVKIDRSVKDVILADPIERLENVKFN